MYTRKAGELSKGVSELLREDDEIKPFGSYCFQTVAYIVNSIFRVCKYFVNETGSGLTDRGKGHKMLTVLVFILEGMTMDYNDLAQDFLEKMRVLSKARPQRKINRFMQGEIFVLNYIFCNEGIAAPGAISDEMEISTARVAAALNSLENKGFITRRTDSRDRRKVLVELTEAGRLRCREYREMAIGDAAGMLCVLGERDAKEFVRILGRLADGIPKQMDATR